MKTMIPKYRIYDKEYNEYCEEPDWRWMLSREGRLYNSENDKWYTVGERFLVEFFTGEKDLNGVEIYDKDILSIEVDNGYEENSFYTGIVIYGRGGKKVGKNFVTDYPCSFTLFVKEWYHEEGILGNSRHEYKVLGNIHENKDLL